MAPVLETHRLILRPLELADAVQVQKIFPQWEVVRFLAKTVPWPYPPDGAYTFFRDVALPADSRGEAWHWTLRLKLNPDQVIGLIVLRKGETKNRGFWIGVPWQKQGFMTEAADAVTDYWFDVLKMPFMRVPKAKDNTGSCRISEQQGMRMVGTEDRDYVSGRLPSEIWAITADEWRARRKHHRSSAGKLE
jgi:ribosomal-protein-alanine N-acetyltransferase